MREKYDKHNIFSFLGAVPNSEFNSAMILMPGEIEKTPVAIFETTTAFNENGTDSIYYFYQNLRTTVRWLDESIRENDDAIIVSKKYAEKYFDNFYPEDPKYDYLKVMDKKISISANRFDGTSEEKLFKIAGIVDSNSQAYNNDGKLFQKYFGDYFFFTSNSGISFFNNLSLYNEYKNDSSNNGLCSLDVLKFANNHGMKLTFTPESLNAGTTIENNIFNEIQRVVNFKSSFVRYFVLVVSAIATIALSIALWISSNKFFVVSDLKNKFDKRFAISF